ncbi:TPA: type II secretion system protein [Escherichia coli]|nr:type II secretion system protein [Escherichia coli]HBN0662757.1 type II secretion system protein [Escherichia coli]HBN0695219.1 type II secretion system protein [Escherichia coli]HBN0776785.1 type II secretion system protein [Escherichia coli]HBN0828473.1 type II secretion system protein [Escherichia coli]
MKKERGFSLVEIALFSVLIGVVMANIYDIKRTFVKNIYHKQLSLAICSYANAFSRYIKMEKNITDNITIEQLKKKGVITPFAESQIGYFTVSFQIIKKNGDQYRLMKLHSNKKITTEEENLISRDIGVYSSIKSPNSLKGLYYSIDIDGDYTPGDGNIYAIIPPHYSKYQRCQ